MTDTDPTSEFPTQGTLMGLDFGTKRLGVAVCDRNQTIASPLNNHDRQGEQHDARMLKKVVEDYQIAGIVIGLPVHMSGDESTKSQEARQFGQWVKTLTSLPVTYWDERHTSTIATAMLMSQDLSKKKQKARLDKLAAQLILQSFLNSEDRTLPPVDLRKRNDG